MSAHDVFHMSSSSLLLLTSVPALLFPKIYTSTILLSHPRDPTDLEMHLLRTASIAQLALALLALSSAPLFTPPSPSSPSSSAASSSSFSSSLSPLRSTRPLLLLFHTATFLHAYTAGSGSQSRALTTLVMHGFVVGVGVWAEVFGGGGAGTGTGTGTGTGGKWGKEGKKEGGGGGGGEGKMRVSGWPFGNRVVEEERARRKDERREKRKGV